MSKSLIFSFIPLYYTFSSRIKTKSERFSWFVIYPLFLFLVGVLFEFNLYLISIAFLAVMSVYEIGYLFNDIITIKKEKDPTIRLNQQSSLFISHFWWHIVIRFLIGFILSYYCFLMTDNAALFVGNALILFTYFIHNHYRNRVNILSYFILVSCRYVVPFLLVMDWSYYGLVICLLICFPLCRTVEHSCKKKYGYKFAQYLSGKFDLFRVVYYSILLLLSSFLYLLDLIDYKYILLISYFLCVRTLFFMARNKVVRTKHSSY